MALTKSIKKWFPGIGHATSYGSALGVAANVGNTTVTVTPSQPCANGYIRVRNSTVGAAATTELTSITATDGVTTYQIYGGDSAASTAGQGIERMIPFFTNLALSSFSVVVAVATANCTVDVEVAGNY